MRVRLPHPAPQVYCAVRLQVLSACTRECKSRKLYESVQLQAFRVMRSQAFGVVPGWLESVDAAVLKIAGLGREGSSPSPGTKF